MDSRARPATSRQGAYGLCLPALAGASALLVDAPSHWEDWQLTVTTGAGRPSEFVQEAHARLLCEPAGWVEIARGSRISSLHLPHQPSVAELLQPRLGTTAIVAAHWRGEQSFHAGAFLVEGRAWGVLGPRHAGKSSMLAALALAGAPVLTDDVLIVNGERLALAGPRCVDLRQATAAALGAGESIGVVGTRERWRLAVGSVPPEVPLGGFVCLEWASRVSAKAVSLDRRVAILLGAFALRVAKRTRHANAALLDLFALPMICVGRPHEVGALAESAAMLHQTIARCGPN